MKSKGNKVKEKTTESNREKAKDTQQQTEQTCTEIRKYPFIFIKRRACLLGVLTVNFLKECPTCEVGLALRLVPSVEQADSAIFCTRVSHILHQVHSLRLAHIQMDPEQQQ